MCGQGHNLARYTGVAREGASTFTWWSVLTCCPPLEKAKGARCTDCLKDGPPLQYTWAAVLPPPPPPPHTHCPTLSAGT